MATSPDPSSDSWGDNALLDTLRGYFGAGSEAGLPDEIRFLVNVATLVEKQIDRDNAPTHPAIFVLRPLVPESISTDVRDVPMLDNGLTDLGGHIWFVGPVFGAARGLPVTDGTDDLFPVLEKLESARPTIYVETATPKTELRFYPSGVTQPNNFEVVTLPRDALDLSEVYRALDGVHRGVLVTPNVMPSVPGLRLWQKPSQYWVAKRAEAAIEHHLHTGLHAAFPTHRVDTQLDEPTGRLDIAIAKPDWGQAGKVTNHVVLELKVLRSFGSKGGPYSPARIKAIVAEGVTQAAAYRDDQNSRLASLCCFDFRKSVTSTCFTAARPLAKRLKVDMRSWRLFPTSKALRAARTEGKP